MSLWWSLIAATVAVLILVAVHRSSREYPWAGQPGRRVLELGGFALAGWLMVFAIGWAVYVSLAQLWQS